MSQYEPNFALTLVFRLILCAIGAHFLHNHQIENWYYEKALTMIPDFIEAPDLDTLIGILLMSIYEISICSMSKAWHHLGMALRSISLLSLDIDPDLLPELRGKNWVEKEKRRLLYWTLYLLDLCM